MERLQENEDVTVEEIERMRMRRVRRSWLTGITLVAAIILLVILVYNAIYTSYDHPVVDGLLSLSVNEAANSRGVTGGDVWFKAFFGPPTTATHPTAVKIYIENGTASCTLIFTSDTLTPQTLSGTTTGVCTSVTYTDLAADGWISGGDFLTLSGLKTGSTYTIKVIQISSGNVVGSLSFVR